MQTEPGPLVIEDPPPGMSCLLMVISSHSEVRSRPWLPVRLSLGIQILLAPVYRTISRTAFRIVDISMPHSIKLN